MALVEEELGTEERAEVLSTVGRIVCRHSDCGVR